MVHFSSLQTVTRPEVEILILCLRDIFTCGCGIIGILLPNGAAIRHKLRDNLYVRRNYQILSRGIKNKVNFIFKRSCWFNNDINRCIRCAHYHLIIPRYAKRTRSVNLFWGSLLLTYPANIFDQLQYEFPGWTNSPLHCMLVHP